MHNPNLSYYAQASKDEQIAMQNWIIGVLRTSGATITFIKRDGSVRTLRASLRVEDLPAGNSTKTNSAQSTACSVWDLEAQAWRSFRWDSIRQVSFSIGQS